MGIGYEGWRRGCGVEVVIVPVVLWELQSQPELMSAFSSRVR